MVDFKQMLAKSREAKAEKLADEIATENSAPSIMSRFKTAKPVVVDEKKVSLTGSGFTKALAEKQTNQINREVSRALDKPSFAQILLKKQQEDKLKDTNDVISEQSNIADATARAQTTFIEAKHIELPAADGIELDESQNAALVGLTYQRFGCLIGAAGTGKTTTTKRLVKRLEATAPLIDFNKAFYRGDKSDSEEQSSQKSDLNVAICFAAYTGRAVQQMKRALPKEYHRMCMTMHAMLGFHPEWFEDIDPEDPLQMKKTMRFVPYFDALNKLPWRIFVFDEAGMIPIDLWNLFMDACPEDARIILIGDINQLPPVQGRSVLGFAMSKWPTFALEKIHRQAADNPIIGAAHNVLNGMYPKKVIGQVDMVCVNGGSMSTFQDCMKVIKALSKKGEFDPVHDAFIVPTNEYQLGQKTFNEHLVVYFNQPQKENGIVINPRVPIATGAGSAIFAVGDKIMLLQNDRPRGLTNGMIGLVSEINANPDYDGKRNGAVDNTQYLEFQSHDNLDLSDLTETMVDLDKEEKEDNSKDAMQRQASHVLTCKFQDGQEVKFKTAGDYRKLVHAYAFTCHKAQGGEFPTVIILCHSANSRMLNREWLYTALTRARQRVILIYNERGLQQALQNQRIKGKDIKQKMQVFIDLEQEGSRGDKIVNMPFLMEAETLDLELSGK